PAKTRNSLGAGESLGMTMRITVTICFCFVSLLRAQPLRLEKTIPLGAINGRIDHLAGDIVGNRLFVAALGNNTVEVVDLDAGKVVHTISGQHEPQGLFYWPENNRLYVANGQDGHLRVYDGRSFAQI